MTKAVLIKLSERVDELEAKLKEEIEISNNRGSMIEFQLLPQMSDLQFENADLKAKLEESEALLEKAVEALKWQASQPEAHPFMAQRAHADLAELTGETE